MSANENSPLLQPINQRIPPTKIRLTLHLHPATVATFTRLLFPDHRVIPVAAATLLLSINC